MSAANGLDLYVHIYKLNTILKTKIFINLTPLFISFHVSKNNFLLKAKNNILKVEHGQMVNEDMKII